MESFKCKRKFFNIFRVRIGCASTMYISMAASDINITFNPGRNPNNELMAHKSFLSPYPNMPVTQKMEHIMNISSMDSRHWPNPFIPFSKDKKIPHAIIGNTIKFFIFLYFVSVYTDTIKPVYSMTSFIINNYIFLS